jgi:transcriptional regulator GlxA family with amidase domain
LVVLSSAAAGATLIINLLCIISDVATSPQLAGLLVLPGFSLCALGCIVEQLSNVAALCERVSYLPVCLSVGGDPVRANGGVMVMPGEPLHVDRAYSLVFVIAGESSAFDGPGTRLENWLGWLDRRGCVLGAVEGGTRILARAGLLDEHLCAVPAAQEQAFTNDFPRVRTIPESFCNDGTRMTCADTAGVPGMMQAFLSEQVGPASAVISLFQAEAKNGSQPPAAAAWRWGISDRRVSVWACRSVSWNVSSEEISAARRTITILRSGCAEHACC